MDPVETLTLFFPESIPREKYAAVVQFARDQLSARVWKTELRVDDIVALSEPASRALYSRGSGSPKPSPEPLDTAAAAQHLGITYSAVHSAKKRGALTPFKKGTKLFFEVADLDRYAMRLKAQKEHRNDGP